eukprot:11011146-Karenia_brevis.AAC.1
MTPVIDGVGACDDRATLYAVFPTAGRLAAKSARSMAVMRLRIHAQYFSMGFRSGDLAGNFHSSILNFFMTAVLSAVRRKLSLSQRILQGPRRLCGLAVCKAFNKPPLFTADVHSSC